MKICQLHWNKLRAGIDARGMGHLVGTQDSLKERIEDEISGTTAIGSFDPLWAANNAITSKGLERFGLQLMGTPTAEEVGFGDTDSNGNAHYCPICVAMKMASGKQDDISEHGISNQSGKVWDAAAEEHYYIDDLLDSFLPFCREHNLIPVECPFCGEPGTLEKDLPSVLGGQLIMYARCTSAACAMAFNGHAMPIDQWNRRSSIPRAQIEALASEWTKLAFTEPHGPLDKGRKACADELRALLHPELKGENKP